MPRLTFPPQRSAAPTIPTPPAQPGLVWGFSIDGERITALGEADLDLLGGGGTDGTEAEFRWLHLNLANQGTRRWIEEQAALPEAVRELMLSSETHQRALVVEGHVACVLHDFEVDFGTEETSRVGSLSLALGANAMLTARHHPLSAGNVVRRRVEAGARPRDAAQAFDLAVGAILEIAARRATVLGVAVQGSEDKLLADGWEPDPKALAALRREGVRLHRQVSGIRAVLQRLETDEELPEPLLATMEKLNQRVVSLHGDVGAAQGDLRLLRDEIDLQMTQRTNRNLYVLSILSALLLPATLVTGFFGMNTGGMPWSGSPHGTLFAGAAVAGSAASIYLWLRGKDFLGS